ncbi:MAG: helix-turn-helix transcriptional regulator [Phycisphaerales bacterium]|nr:helix-turn-helix transcriptional regulator [Phycisphaerales bacterium]
MEFLTNEDYRQMLEVIGSVGVATTPDELQQKMVLLLARLVPADIISYTEVNPATGRVSGIIHPDEFDLSHLTTALQRYMHEHPVIMHMQQTGSHHAFRISDFMSQSQLHDTGLYMELYRGLGVEFQIAITVPTRKPVIGALVLNRRSRDFSERDRTVLNMLRPHLANAFEMAQITARLQSQLSRHKGVLDHLPDGVVLLQGVTRVGMWTHKARIWLDKYFPGDGRKAGSLPTEICDWLRRLQSARQVVAGEPIETLLLKNNNRDQLSIHFVQRDGAPAMLVLEEQQSPTSARPLEGLGLSSRQAEVLMGVAQGMADKQIAGVLRISTRTVQKHCQAIFKVLKVGGRTEAASVAWQRLRGSGPKVLGMLIGLAFAAANMT